MMQWLDNDKTFRLRVVLLSILGVVCIEGFSPHSVSMLGPAGPSSGLGSALGSGLGMRSVSQSAHRSFRWTYTYLNTNTNTNSNTMTLMHSSTREKSSDINKDIEVDLNGAIPNDNDNNDIINSQNNANNHSNNHSNHHNHSNNNNNHQSKPNIAQRLVDIYINYISKLWKETDVEHRSKIANQKALHAIRNVQHLLMEGSAGNEYVTDDILNLNARDTETMDDMEQRAKARLDLLNACDVMLKAVKYDDNDKENDKENDDAATTATTAKAVQKDTDANGETLTVHTTLEKDIIDAAAASTSTTTTTSSQQVEDINSYPNQIIATTTEESAVAVAISTSTSSASTSTSASDVAKPNKNVKKKKSSRSILFGASMGAIVTAWVFSGNFLFMALFTLMTALGQLEYYRMVMRIGIYPARKISVLGACAMFITAMFAPQLHQICLPFFATYAMIWFLTMRRKVSTIPDIASTFTGMFYLGYIPSFWVRIRCITDTAANTTPTTLLRPFIGPLLDKIHVHAKSILPRFSNFVHSPITPGSVFIFWTWLSIAFSDVGAYFVGRKFGKTKLGSIFPAAGAASPNKTVEGYIGGSIVCAMFASVGAWIMQWPYWYITGPTHGIVLAFLGLVGDLTASMLKRDSGLKDFGDLLPEHGGIMDRVDSFVFTAPYSWLVCQFVIPALRAKAKFAIP